MCYLQRCQHRYAKFMLSFNRTLFKKIHTRHLSLRLYIHVKKSSRGTSELTRYGRTDGCTRGMGDPHWRARSGVGHAPVTPCYPCPSDHLNLTPAHYQVTMHPTTGSTHVIYVVVEGRGVVTFFIYILHRY